MATSGDSENLSHSQINAGDGFYNLCCTPCSKTDTNKQASKYCANCKEYYCVTRVTSHNSFKALSGHALVDPNTTKRSSSKTGQSFHGVPTELCSKHPMEVINMFCREEDIVGCVVCFTLDHKSCKDIHYIPEYIPSNFPARQVNQINKDLTNTIQAMKKLKRQHDRLDSNLDERKRHCQREIQKYRDDINHIIDKIESATMAKLDAKHKDMKKETNVANLNIQDMHDTMVRFKTGIESDQSNDSQKFVLAKLSQSMIRQGQQLQSEMSQDKNTDLAFSRNTDIMTFLLSIVTLGMLSPQTIQDSTTCGSKQPKQTKSTISPSPFSVNRVSQKPSTQSQDTTVARRPGLYKMIDKREYSIQQLDDMNVSSICSSCILDDNYILLADYGNKKLKLMNRRTYTIRTSLALKAAPLSVCRVSNTEAAVCLDNKTILFVSTYNELVSKHNIRIPNLMPHIAVIKDMMYLADSSSVYAYSLKGKLVKTIYKVTPGKYLFSLSSVDGITVSDDEKMIHVADYDNGVITLNIDGNVVWRYIMHGNDIKAPALCTDGNGNLIVYDIISKNVIQLGPDGQYMGEIVSREDYVNNPATVCYDKNNHELILGCCSSNYIQVIKMQ